MKTSQNGFVITIVAAEAITEKRFVTPDGKHTAAAHSAGVAGYDANSGDPVSVDHGPIAVVEAGAAVAAMAEVESDSSGRAVTLSSGKLAGVALDAASAAGEFIRVLIK